MPVGRAENGELPTTLLRCLADGACRTIDELDETLALDRRQISDAAFRLINRGYAERVERGCYRLTADGIAAAERGEALTGGPSGPDTVQVRKPWRDTSRQRAWAAMRMSGAFTVGEIAMAALRDADPAAEDNLRRYVLQLKRAGYLVELPVRQSGTKLTSNGFKRFRLIRDTGFEAPVYRTKTKALHDYNTGEDVPCGK